METFRIGHSSAILVGKKILGTTTVIAKERHLL
jgi:hypothetical protein